MSSENQCFVNAMLKIWARDKIRNIRKINFVRWWPLRERTLFQSLLPPDIFDCICKRNISGGKGERSAFPQSFRSLRCVSAHLLRQRSSVSKTFIFLAKAEGSKRTTPCWAFRFRIILPIAVVSKSLWISFFICKHSETKASASLLQNRFRLLHLITSLEFQKL